MGKRNADEAAVPARRAAAAESAAAEPDASASPGRSWRWLVAIFTICSITETLGFGHFTAFSPIYLPQLGVAPADVPRWTGILAASSIVLGLPLAPLWGVWADKYSRKLIILRSAVGEALIFLIAALSQNVWQLLLARLLAGFILGNTGVMFAVLAGAAPRERLAFAIALVQMGSTIGMSLGPLLGGILIGRIGIPSLFALDCVLALASAALLAFGFHERRHDARDPRPVLQMLRALPRTLLAVPAILPLYGVQLLLLLGAQASTPFVPLLVEELYAGDDLPLAIGLVMTSYGLMSAACIAIWGRLGDRLGRLRVLHLTLLASTVALLAQALAPTYEALLVGRALQGAFQAAAAPLIIALIAASTPEAQRASVLNLSQFPFYFAAIAGGALGSVLAALHLRAVFFGATASTAIALGVLARLTRGGRLG